MGQRFMMLGALAIASALGVNFLAILPAEARPACMYIARDPSGNIMADGYAWAMKRAGLAIGQSAAATGSSNANAATAKPAGANADASPATTEAETAARSPCKAELPTAGIQP